MRVIGSLLGVFVGILGMLIACYQLLLETFALSGTDPHLATREAYGLVAMGLGLSMIVASIPAIKRESRVCGWALIALAGVAAAVVPSPAIKAVLVTSFIPGVLLVLVYRGDADRDPVWRRLYAAARARGRRLSGVMRPNVAKRLPRDPQFHV